MKRIESLDILRAFAALSVFFYHINVVGNNPFNGFFDFNGIGVDLFFVLSGFFIGLSVINTKEWRVTLFLKKRFIRIAPAYYVSLIIMLALVTPPYILTFSGVIDVISHLSFLHSITYNTHGSLNGSYWSLGIEVYFYILMAASALLLRDSKIRFKVLFCWIIIALLWRYWVSTLALEPVFKFILATQLPGMLDEFSYGIIVAIIVSNKNILNIIKMKQYLFISFTVAIIGVSFYVKYQYRGNYWSSWDLLVIGRSILALSFALLITSFISLSQYSDFNHYLSFSGIPFIGKISYSFYLYHLPVIIAMKNAGILTNNNITSGIFCLIITLLLSSISYYLVEKRFNNNC